MTLEYAIIIGGVLALIFSLFSALVGLGWAKRSFEKHVVGYESLDFANRQFVTQQENSKIKAKGNRSGTVEELLDYKD